MSSNTAARFRLVIAVLLSAQATDKSVNAAATQVFPFVKTPAISCSSARPATFRAHQDHRTRFLMQAKTQSPLRN